MKKYIILALIFLAKATLQIDANPSERIEEVPTTQNADNTLTASKNAGKTAITATIKLDSNNPTTGKITSITNAKPADLIKSINVQLTTDLGTKALSSAEQAALAHNIPAQKNGSWDNFNTELDKILTSRSVNNNKLTLNHEQLILDLHLAETQTNTLTNLFDNISLTIKKLLNNTTLPTPNNKLTGITISSKAQDQIISILPIEMQSLNTGINDNGPQDIKHFNTLLQQPENLTKIQNANSTVIAKILKNVTIDDLNTALTKSNYNSLQPHEIDLINEFLDNISHLTATQTRYGLDGKAVQDIVSDNISRDSSHSLYVSSDNYTEIRTMIKIFTKNLGNPSKLASIQEEEATSTAPINSESGFTLNDSLQSPMKSLKVFNPKTPVKASSVNISQSKPKSTVKSILPQKASAISDSEFTFTNSLNSKSA